MDKITNALGGKRVVITRAPQQSARLLEKLSVLGAIAISLPLVAFASPEDFAPLDAAIAQLEEFDRIIFTSENAVRAVVNRANLRGNLKNVAGRRARCAVVGPTTAGAARRAGFFVEYEAETHSGAALATELGQSVREQTIFLPRSDRANPDLPALLRKNGAVVTEVIAYRTVTPVNLDRDKLAQILSGHADAILFFSPTAVEHFTTLVGENEFRELQNRLAIVAIGPVTAKALSSISIDRVSIAADTTADSAIHALQKYFREPAKIATVGARHE